MVNPNENSMTAEISEDDFDCHILYGRPLSVRDLTRQQFKYIYGLARVYNEMCASSDALQRYFELKESKVVVELCASIFFDFSISPRVSRKPLNLRLSKYKKAKSWSRALLHKNSYYIGVDLAKGIDCCAGCSEHMCECLPF